MPMIEFKRPDGGSSRGHEAGAADAPGVVVIQEWWGLNPQICGVVDRLAAAGFRALAPDLYRGRLAASADEASHLMQGLDFRDAALQDLRGAAQHLGANGRRVAVMGFCMGGALSIVAAVHVREFAAASCFYGVPPAQIARPADIAIPFQAHFAERDDWCTPKLVHQLESEMQAAGRAAEIHHYAAQHGFFNERRAEVHDPQCAELAWTRLLDFLRRQL